MAVEVGGAGIFGDGFGFLRAKLKDREAPPRAAMLCNDENFCRETRESQSPKVRRSLAVMCLCGFMVGMGWDVGMGCWDENGWLVMEVVSSVHGDGMVRKERNWLHEWRPA